MKWKLTDLPEEYQKQLEEKLAKENSNRTTHTATNVEPRTGNEPMGAQEATGCDSRCSIHVRSIRSRLADPDGICAKAAIDGLQRCGILQDDSAKHVKEVTYSQEKGEPEKTIITLEWE